MGSSGLINDICNSDGSIKKDCVDRWIREKKKYSIESNWLGKMIFGNDRLFRQRHIEDIIFMISREFLLSSNNFRLSSDGINFLGHLRSQTNDNTTPIPVFQTLCMLLDKSKLTIMRSIAQSVDMPEWFILKKRDILKEMGYDHEKIDLSNIEDVLTVALSKEALSDKMKKDVFREIFLVDMEITPRVLVDKKTGRASFINHSDIVNVETEMKTLKRFLEIHSRAINSYSEINKELSNSESSSSSSSANDINQENRESSANKSFKSEFVKMSVSLGIQKYQIAEYKKIVFLTLLGIYVRNRGIVYFEGKNNDVSCVLKDMRDCLLMSCFCLWPSITDDILSKKNNKKYYFAHPDARSFIKHFFLYFSPYIDDIISLDYQKNELDVDEKNQNDKNEFFKYNNEEHILDIEDIIHGNYDDDRIVLDEFVKQCRYNFFSILDSNASELKTIYKKK